MGCLLFFSAGNIQMHPGGSSLTSDPFINLSVGRFFDPLLASLYGVSSSNPGLFVLLVLPIPVVDALGER
jgi:hypothetical protein